VAASALCEVPISFTPVATQRHDYTVHVIDDSTKTLHAAFLVSTLTKIPPISKQFEVRIEVGRTTSKKIAYTNPYGFDKEFRLKTNCPSLLSFKHAHLHVPAGESRYISLKLLPVETRGMAEILVFINDREDKNEECLCVRAVYQ
jgi:nephrocystin-4